MSYQKFVTIRMSDAMHAALHALAKERGTDVGKLVRQLISQELSGTRDRLPEALDQILFLAIMVDGVYAQREPELRAQLVQIWRDRLADEGRHHR